MDLILSLPILGKARIHPCKANYADWVSSLISGEICSHTGGKAKLEKLCC